MLAVVKKEVAKREQSAQIYTDAGAEDRAQAELSEAAVLRGFLPREASSYEIEMAVAEILETLGNDLVEQSGRAIGAIMSQLKTRLENFDSRAAVQVIRRELGL